MAASFRSPGGMGRSATLLALRLAAGGVFVVFGVGKFVNHGAELASFKAYGLPAPELFVVVIGVVELVGGMLLIAGILTRPWRWCSPATCSARSWCQAWRTGR